MRSLTEHEGKREARSVIRTRAVSVVAAWLIYFSNVGASLRAEPEEALLARFAHEPSVTALQQAAIKYAALDPERVASWLRRVRTAALAPDVHVRFWRGLSDFEYLHAIDAANPTLVSGEQWRVEIAASWSLERLVFHHDELMLSREAQRIASRREQLTSRVAEVYYARRRLQVQDVLGPGTDLERRFQIDELTAVLDGLTGGALSQKGR